MEYILTACRVDFDHGKGLDINEQPQVRSDLEIVSCQRRRYMNAGSRHVQYVADNLSAGLISDLIIRTTTVRRILNEKQGNPWSL
jgi:hypothetical protein